FPPDELRRNSCESSVKPFKGRTSQPSATTRVGASMEIPSGSRLQHHPQHPPTARAGWHVCRRWLCTCHRASR
ncbi:hypothetical protein Ancab_013238, partial [Ancistrocladus abbreviatus]